MSSGKYLITLLSLLALFSTYNYIIYSDSSAYGNVRLSEKGIQGENLWLTNNCNSCHQIYGLGGYLGPDLTNVYSLRNNEYYLKSMLNTGVKAMPQFNFSQTEKEQLVQFLKEIDQTGHYPATDAQIQTNGWVKIPYKDENHAQ